MKRVRRIGKGRRRVAAGFRFMKMRMEDDACSMANGPANRLRIAPSFVTDCDAECDRADMKNSPAETRRIGALLGGIELDFVLKARGGSIAIDHQRGRPERAIHNALRTENHRDIRLARGSRQRGPGARKKLRIGRRDSFPASSRGHSLSVWLFARA